MCGTTPSPSPEKVEIYKELLKYQFLQKIWIQSIEKKIIGVISVSIYARSIARIKSSFNFNGNIVFYERYYNTEKSP